MKGFGWQLRRTRVFALGVLVLTGGAFLVSTSVSSEVVPISQECPFEGDHVISIDGLGQFNVDTAELIGARGGEKYLDRKGLATRPIEILGMAGRGYAEGVGETMYWLDKSRPMDGSMVKARAQGADFPAVHEMHFHLFLTTDALPGRTFRSINPAVMVNNRAMSFPPRQGSRYVLKNVVEFEDVNEPGVVVISILSNRNERVGRERHNLDLDRRDS